MQCTLRLFTGVDSWRPAPPSQCTSWWTSNQPPLHNVTQQSLVAPWSPKLHHASLDHPEDYVQETSQPIWATGEKNEHKIHGAGSTCANCTKIVHKNETYRTGEKRKTQRKEHFVIWIGWNLKNCIPRNPWVKLWNKLHFAHTSLQLKMWPV